MKNILKLCLLCLVIASCKEDLEVPLSELTLDDVTPNKEFANTLVVGAYAAMNSDMSNGEAWGSAESNWIWGSVASDDAYKGSEAGDQSAITQTEIYNVLPSNGFLEKRWKILYEGVTRANAAITFLNAALISGDIVPADANLLLGEARFLRGHFHFEAKKMFGNVPFIDENTTVTPSNDPSTSNDVWDSIEGDFQFAIDNISRLDRDPNDGGRVTKWTAKSYMARVHMYQLDYTKAKPVLDEVINSGKYSLNVSFHDNFNGSTNNSDESIFAVQYAHGDGTNDGQNANYGDVLNYPHSNSPFGCCGFHQPSHDLVNAFLTDANGLPAPLPTDPADYVKSVDPSDIVGGNPRNADDATFVPETRSLDPRLDWTVGRKGISFNGWGDYAGLLWVRDAVNGGPFMPKKNVWEKSQDGTSGKNGNWGQKLNTINTNIIRYAEVLLWRAEVAAAEGDLAGAVTFVDQVRARAANAAHFVKKADGTDAANYNIGLYAANGGFPDVTFAEAAIMKEHRLEMAMEGHRFFDLVRRGKADMVLNGYLSRPQFRPYLVSGTSFTVNKGFYPIPQAILDLSGGALKQNPGY